MTVLLVPSRLESCFNVTGRSRLNAAPFETGIKKLDQPSKKL